MKLFIAYDFDDETLKRLSIIQNKLKKHSEAGKWPFYKNIHLVVKYMDEVDESQLNGLLKTLETVFPTGINLEYSFNELGLYRSKDIIRYAWINLTGNTDKLNKIHNSVDYELNKIGIKKEKRKYSPNIMLGRDISFNTTLVNLNEIIKKEMKHSFRFESATLYKSILKDNKVIYEPMKTYYFGRGKNVK